MRQVTSIGLQAGSNKCSWLPDTFREHFHLATCPTSNFVLLVIN